MTVRITYNSINVDLLVGDKSIRPAYSQKRHQHHAADGNIETINLYGLVALEFDACFDQDTYHELISWWSWARKSQAWSFAMDAARTVDTTLDGTAVGSSVTVPLSSTAGLAVGDLCHIAGAADDRFEACEIDSIAAGVSMDLVQGLVFTYSSGDTFRHQEYWPAVVSLDEDFLPVRNGDFFRHTFKFAEAK